jgi:L-alanine-DL-glutamate epimerase-like enolase superfamily enzyme
MDGSLLLTEDVAKGVTFENGKIIYTDKPGLGIELVGWEHG